MDTPTIFLFELKPDGSLRPRLPRTKSGNMRMPDGSRILSLDQASDRVQKPREELQADWLDAFDDVVEGEQILAGISPADTEHVARQKFAHLKSEADFREVLAVCKERGLNPLLDHVWADNCWDNNRKGLRLKVGVTIDGLRLLCARDGRWERVGPRWCGPDMVFKKVWLATEPPSAARTLIYPVGLKRPYEGLCDWLGWAPMTPKEGGEAKVPKNWEERGAHMLGKCSEAAALRAAYPNAAAGLFTPDEMRRGPQAGPGLHIAGDEPLTSDSAEMSNSSFQCALRDEGYATQAARDAVIADHRSKTGDMSDTDPVAFRRRVLGAVRNRMKMA